jgi:peptidase C25-like protein
MLPRMVKPLRWLCLFFLFSGADALAQTPVWYPLDESPAGSPAEVVLLPAASSATQTTFDVIIHGFWAETRIGPGGTTYTKIDVPGLQNLGQVGAPHLPIARKLLAVPTDAPSISFASMTPLSVMHTYTLHLWPEPVMAQQGQTEIPEEFMLDPSVYGSAVAYPYIAGIGQALDGRASVPDAPVEAYPFRWTPATDQLQVHAISRWQFDHGGGVRIMNPITRDRGRMCQATLFNWNVVDQYFPGNTATYQGEYLFVYPSVYLPSIKALIAQKKARGFTVGQIVTDTLSVMTPDSVKEAIRHWYLGTPVNADHYCLLAAEAGRILPFNEGTNQKPEWTDDTFGYMYNNWYIPDIYIGRLAPVDATDMTHQVSKILDYSDHPVASPVYYRYVLLVSHKNSDFQTAQDSVYNASYATPPIFEKYYGSNSASNNAGVTSRVNFGEGITCYRGHGGPTEWFDWDQSAQDYRFSDVDALANGKRTTVVWTIACNNSDLFDQHGIGLHWMSRFPGGAVSHYGATVPSNHYVNDVLEIELFESVWNKAITIQGMAIARAEEKMFEADNVFGGFNVMVYTLLGDPAMPIRRDAPPNWTVDSQTFVPVVPNGQHTGLDIRVRDESGAPVDALVSLWKPGVVTPADEIATNHYTGTDGWAHFLVSPQSSGFVYFSVVDTLGNAVTDSIPVSGAAGAGEGSGRTRPFHAEPTVTRAGTRWVFEHPAVSSTSMVIVAVDGRRVTTLTVPAGAREILWTGTNDRGERVACGMYLAELRRGANTATARVFVVH